MKSLRSLSFFCFVFFIHAIVSAQHSNAPLYSDYKPYSNEPGTYFGNDCSSLFYDTTGHSKARFKALVLKLYSVADSTLQNKKLVSKATVSFDKKGKKELAVRTDSNGRIVDSTRNEYDTKGNKIRETEYGVVNSTEWLQLVADEVITWDNKGNLLVDSVVKRNDEMSETDMKEYKTILSKYTYDDSGNVTSTLYTDGDDSTLLIYRKEGTNSIMEEKRRSGSSYTSSYQKINAAGNEVESVNVSVGDTVVTKSMYNDNNRITEVDQYTNGKISHMVSTDYQKDGGYIETEQDISNEGGISCPNNTKTITTYSKDSVELTKESVEENEGRPITTKLIHYYIFHNREILFDSAVTTKYGYLYSETSIDISTNKYDAHGKIIENAKTGGGETADNSKQTWTYNKAGNLLETDTYGSCLDKPFSVERFTYYADDKKIKEHYAEQGDTKTMIFFGEDTRYAEEVDISPDKNYELIYEYVK